MIRTSPIHDNERKPLRIGFLLADCFTLSAFAGFVDVLRLAADEADRSRPILCRWTVLSETRDLIRSSCGILVQSETRFRDVGKLDYIVVVGGLLRDDSQLSNDAIRFLRASTQSGSSLVGLCTGVFLLHRAGLLDGYKCCVSWFHHDDFIAQFEKTKPVSDQIFVVDRDRLTCSGGHSTAHLAAFLVERHVGKLEASKSLNIMMIDQALSGEQPQPLDQIALSAHDPLVRKALIRIKQSILNPESVSKLADGLCVNKRLLERRFKKDLGISPYRASRRVRINEACKLLVNSDQTVAQLALEAGFCDGPHMIRVFKSELGQTPAAFRREHSLSDMARLKENKNS